MHPFVAVVIVEVCLLGLPTSHFCTSPMKFTLAVRHHDDSMHPLTVNLSPEATLREVFATIAKGIGCHPLSLSFRTWAGGSCTNVPHPPNQETREEHDSFERIWRHPSIPEKRMLVELRRAMAEQHWVQQVVAARLPFLEGDLCGMTRLFGEAFVVRVLDPIVDSIPRDVTDETVSTAHTVHQAIQHVFGEVKHNRHESWSLRRTGDCGLEAFCSLPSQFQQNLDVILAVVGMGVGALCHAPDHFKSDYRMVLAACTAPYDDTMNPDHPLKFAHESLQADECLVMESIKAYPLSLQHAAPSLRNNPHVLKVAMKLNFRAYKFASQTLRDTHKELAMMFAETCDVHEICGPSCERPIRCCDFMRLWGGDRDIVHVLLRRATTIGDVCKMYRDLRSPLTTCRDTLNLVIEQSLLTPHDEHSGDVNDSLTEWESVELVASILPALMNKHEHNPKCEMTGLLNFPCVSSDRSAVHRVIPRCNFRGYFIEEEAATALTSDKETVLRLVKFHPYVLDFTEDDDGWCIPEIYKTDADVLEAAQSTKRQRVQ